MVILALFLDSRTFLVVNKIFLLSEHKTNQLRTFLVIIELNIFGQMFTRGTDSSKMFVEDLHFWSRRFILEIVF